MVSNVYVVVVSKGYLSPEVTDMVTSSDEVYFQVPDLDDLAREVDELTGGASSEVGVPSCSDVAGEQKIGMSVTVGDQTVRRVSMKRTHPVDAHVTREKKEIPGKRDCSLCPSGFFCRTPVRRHAVKYHLSWFQKLLVGHARSSTDLASSYTSTVWKRRRERSRRAPKM